MLEGSQADYSEGGSDMDLDDTKREVKKLLSKVSPHDLFAWAEKDRLEYTTLALLAGHLHEKVHAKKNGKA